ncbi:hypothetical protein NDR87_01075 [Nocardia sp. CDC159]|uniref:Uncharacterized protein n=1 Tax=Nocardia pulmonis TaxID=2951408 RepID=A0A9X2E1P9_9NOCA|nr:MULTISPECIES: hypothetical protein [Nocardia]MCM6772397.1 hypothetical protein [Nocardia pulmonis]MCM6784945.1 hypothetical protein [Nocardia sp. CDC159]
MRIDARTRTLRLTLALLSGLVAIWALTGAAGLATGVVSLGGTLEQRLPWHSPAFAAIMLALIVGAPMAATAWWAAHKNRRTAAAAVLSGSALIGWILVQLAVIRTGSWLQPVCVILGAAILALGLRLRS